MEASPIICETQRLLLRTVTMEDAEFAYRTTSDTEVARFIGGVRTLDWHIQRAKEIIEHQRIHGFARWSVILKSTGEQIGRCGPMIKEIEGVPEVELGYAFVRQHWGHGYAREAAHAALDHAFGALDQRRIVAIIDPGNHRSIRVATKVGMTFDGMIDWEGESANLYSITSGRVSKSS